MKKSGKLFYSLALVGAMLVLVGDDCDCDKPIPALTYVTCVDGKPVLTDGFKTSAAGANFNPADYKCPDDRDSPIWIGSGAPTYPVEPVYNLASGGKERAATGDTTAYSHQLLLDLPFLPMPAPPTASLTTCDASAPDILQVNHDNAAITRLSTCPFAVKKTIRVASRPLQIAIVPNGQMALVTSFDNAISFIDLSTNTVAFTMNVSFNPHGIAITSDGKTAFVSSFDNFNPLIATIDIASHTVTKTISIAAYPQSVFLSPDDAQLYIVFPFANAVYIMDTMTSVISNTYAVTGPRGVAFNSRGTKAFFTSATGGSTGVVHQFDTERFQIEKSYQVGAGPTDISVLYGDAVVAVINYEGGSTSSINLSTGKVTTTPLGGPAIGLSIIR